MVLAARNVAEQLARNSDCLKDGSRMLEMRRDRLVSERQKRLIEEGCDSCEEEDEELSRIQAEYTEKCAVLNGEGAGVEHAIAGAQAELAARNIDLSRVLRTLRDGKEPGQCMAGLSHVERAAACLLEVAPPAVRAKAPPSLPPGLMD